MMKPQEISIQDARRLAVSSQGYSEHSRGKGAQNGLLAVIEKAGYIQIDTISVVQRAHHHALWNRERGYREELLDELQARDRTIFEYWGHAASYLPMADYRYYLPLSRRFVDPNNKWFAVRLAHCRDHLEPVLRLIRQEGPKGARDFETPRGHQNGWWEWKPAKAALEVLFWRGELMISHRSGFQKVFDLPERVLPSWVDTSWPTESELVHFVARRALRAHGLVTPDDLTRFLFGGEKAAMQRALDELTESGEAVLVRVVNGSSSHAAFADAQALEGLNEPLTGPDRVFILSPFDNLVINRRRLSRIFAYDYTIECYVPAAKRKFGYFALPILYGSELVGRMDAKADRREKKLVVLKLGFESGFSVNKAFLNRFRKSLVTFARFNGCEEVEGEKKWT